MASEGSNLPSGVALVNIGPAGSRPEAVEESLKPCNSKKEVLAAHVHYFTCDATDLSLQVRANKSSQVSSETDTDEMDGAQRRSFLLQTQHSSKSDTDVSIRLTWA